MNIYEKCLKRKGEKIANKMVMLNAGVSDFCLIYQCAIHLCPMLEMNCEQTRLFA